MAARVCRELGVCAEPGDGRRDGSFSRRSAGEWRARSANGNARLAAARARDGRSMGKKTGATNRADSRMDVDQRGALFRSTDTMYYMFAGPDFLYANIFFPFANTYILAGLEPVGQVPDLSLSARSARRQLSALRASISSILKFQYFITKDMRTELGRGGVAGTLPILYVFLARLGYSILDVTAVTSPASGIKITFRDPAREQTQTLYYFKTDLSGSGQQPFSEMVRRARPGTQLAQGRLIPDAWRRLQWRAEFSSRTQPRHFTGRFWNSAACFSQRVGSALLWSLRPASNRVCEIYPTGSPRGLSKQSDLRRWDSPSVITGRKKKACSCWRRLVEQGRLRKCHR